MVILPRNIPGLDKPQMITQNGNTLGKINQGMFTQGMIIQNRNTHGKPFQILPREFPSIR